MGVLPKTTVARLPRYLRYLDDLPRQTETVSSEDIAQGAGVSAALVRKDLSLLGAAGRRGIGYDLHRLEAVISRVLGLGAKLAVAIVGAGHLGTALANYAGFKVRGFEIAGIYDIHPARVGTVSGPVQVRHLDWLAEDMANEQYQIGIIATPANAAQTVGDLMVAAGIRSILNFAPAVIRLPEAVTLRQVDLAIELQILSFHLAQ